MKEQLNVRLDAALARQLKQEAQEQGRTVGGIVALALEAWLSKASSVVAGDSSSPDQQALAALEARVAKLEAANKGSNRTLNQGDNINLRNNDENQGADRTLKNNDEINPCQGMARLEKAERTKIEWPLATLSQDNVKVKNNDESRGDNVTPTELPYHDKAVKSQSTTQGPSDRRSSQGITTAELAIQTGTNKGAWNNWASKASPGDIRHHAQAGSWRLLGKTAPASGGPPRWMWEQA